MNTEIEGFTLALLVVVALVVMLAATLRLAQQRRDRRLGRELEQELARTAVMAKAPRPVLGRA